MAVALPPLQSSWHEVQHEGLTLAVWEKCETGTPDATRPVVVLAHGSATGGRESFDLQVPGQADDSLMDVLARQGFDVFALDVRGFGRSTRPPAGVSTEQAASDLQAVVAYVCRLRQVAAVNLLAWSWGTQYSGQFVMANPGQVLRYISYAQMHLHSPDLIQRRERLATFQRAPYLRITEAGWKLRFHSNTPERVNRVEVIDAFARAAVAVESQTPTGPQVDLLTRMPLVDATRITVPVLMVHGEYDDVADEAGLRPFFEALPNPHKRYAVVKDGGHMLHLQLGHEAFKRAVLDFLTTSVPDA
jgi:pimeloyl-ACP methyl ester carboxylesterase